MSPPPPDNRPHPAKDPATKVSDVVDAADARTQTPSTHATTHGPVVLGLIRQVPATGDTPTHLEVWAPSQNPGDDPHLRIFNPPRYVPDPAGPLEMNGRRFREDPLTAVAELVARVRGADNRRAR